MKMETNNNLPKEDKALFNAFVRDIISDKTYFTDEDDAEILDFIPGNVREKAEHDAVLYGDSFLTVYRAPEWVAKYMQRQRWIDGIRDPKFDILTGCAKCFKPETTYTWYDKLLKHIMANSTYGMLAVPRGMLTVPRSFNKGRVLNRYGNMSVHIDIFPIHMSKHLVLEDVIHLRWSKISLWDVKVKPPTFYASADMQPIERILLESLGMFGTNMVENGILTTPNLNNKKNLERVIKKGRKHK